MLARCAKKDETALEEIYRLASAKLYGMCLALVKRGDVAEDLLQECFLKIWERAGSYNPAKGAGMTWMMSIVRNRALDHLRSTRVKIEQSSLEFRDEDFQAGGSDEPFHATDLEASTAAVARCLEQLQEQQRRCILMAYYQGYTHDELSRKIDAPLGTVKAWIRRGMERLRQCLE